MSATGSRRPRIYVASPLGFSATTRSFYDDCLLPALAKAGFEVLDPWESAMEGNGPSLDDGERNARLIDSCDAVFAVLDGVDVDSGTAAEIGYAAARGLPVVGVRTDLRRSGESDAAVVNLQVEYFIRRRGSVVGRFEEAIVELRRILGDDQ